MGKVSVEFLENGLAVLHLGGSDEKLVTLNFERMDSLWDALQQVGAKKPKGLILVGPSPEMFTAGADINLIRDAKDPHEAEKLAKRGQEIFEYLERLPFPTVAAISGPCVGGGCEMVLACTHRVITDHKSSTIGLPEIKLGILPGFGGTQRLPRLVGLPAALSVILQGKTLKPKQALKMGLVDAITSVEQLRQKAEQFALGTAQVKKRQLPFRDRLLTNTKLGRMFVRRSATQTIEKETKGFYPAPKAALEATLLGLEQGREVGFKFEAQELGRLIVTPESKSLVRLFFLSEASKALGKSGRKHVEHIHAAVLGAGVMGAGIAGILAKNECSVILKDTTDEALNRGLNHIRKYVGKLSYLSESERSFILNRVETTKGDSPNFGNANLAIEAIFEDLEVKRKALGELSKLLPPDAIIATNTSSLSVSAIAQLIDTPERIIGMHFFNPVEKMPLVEIIRGEKSNDKTIAVISALTTKLGKFPIIVEDVPGFLVNRVLTPYLTEAAFLLSEGASIKMIDGAATAFGMPMGPLRLLDEVGLDVAAHVSEIMVKGYGERMQGPGHAKLLLGLGRRGKKNEQGFYNYKGKDASPEANIHSMLNITSTQSSGFSQTEVTARLILPLINEAVRCLDEGVAGHPGPEAAGQVDLGSVMGIGFPPFRGGVLNYAQSIGAKKLNEDLTRLAKTYGSRFQPADGIRIRAERNLSLQDRVGK